MADALKSLLAWRCRRWRARLVELAGGELPASGREALEAHLRGCSRCARELESLRVVPDTFAGEAPDDPGPEYWLVQRQAIMRAIREAERMQEPDVETAPRWDWRLAVAPVTALLVAVLGWVALRQQFSAVVQQAQAPVAEEQMDVALLDAAPLFGLGAEEVAESTMTESDLLAEAGAALGLGNELEVSLEFEDLTPAEQELVIEWVGGTV